MSLSIWVYVLVGFASFLWTFSCSVSACSGDDKSAQGACDARDSASPDKNDQDAACAHVSSSLSESQTQVLLLPSIGQDHLQIPSHSVFSGTCRQPSHFAVPPFTPFRATSILRLLRKYFRTCRTNSSFELAVHYGSKKGFGFAQFIFGKIFGGTEF